MKNCIISMAFVVFSFTPIGGASAGYIVNGGFETGDFTGWTLVGDPQTTFVDTGFTHSGTYAAFLGETGGLGSLSQSFLTSIGTKYTLSFWFAGDGDDPSEFSASVGGNLLVDLVNPQFDIDYQKYQYAFIASGSSTVLSFSFRDDDFFLNLDDVSVDIASVPEPASFWLVSLGVPFLIITTKKFRSYISN
jgi:hypothetical protein